MDPQTKPNRTTFADLPIEIRTHIWKLMVPDPREMDEAITFISDLNLAHTRAILPSFREWASVYQRVCDRWGIDNDDALQIVLDRYPSSPADLTVITLLHVCRESRDIALKMLSLEIESNLRGEDRPLFNAFDDIVYFIDTPVKWRSLVATMYLLRDSLRPIRFLSDARHVAFRMGIRFLGSLEDIGYNPDLDRWISFNLESSPDDERQSCRDRWYSAFPKLESISLFIDHPGDSTDETDGTLRLSESMDVPVQQILQKTPAELVARVASQFDIPELHLDDIEEARRPDIKLFVITRRPPNHKREKRRRGLAVDRKTGSLRSPKSALSNSRFYCPPRGGIHG